VKVDIHPTWFEDAKIVCATCGTEWVTGSTTETLRIDICSNCHPFYTGEQKIVDTEGMVDKFMKRLQVRDKREAEIQAKEDALKNADVPLEDLELGKRYITILNDNGIKLVSVVITKLDEEGDDSILSISGIGVKVLADAKRKMSELGFEYKK
jgi:large subunit ribosomal protein L31